MEENGTCIAGYDCNVITCLCTELKEQKENDRKMRWTIVYVKK